MQNSESERLLDMTRRHFFGRTGFGIGALALSSLLDGRLFGAETNPLAPKTPHFPPKAKRVIYMFMEGAPSQLDLFDYKPKLVQLNMQPCPEEMIKGERFAFIKGVPKILGSRIVSPAWPVRHGTRIASPFGRRWWTTSAWSAPWSRRFQSCAGPDFLQHRPSDWPAPAWVPGSITDWAAIAQDLPGFVVMISGGGLPSGGGLLEQRLFAHRLSGRAIPLPGRSGVVPVQSRRHERAGPAPFPRCLCTTRMKWK